jgi:hypothetical protein
VCLQVKRGTGGRCATPDRFKKWICSVLRAIGSFIECFVVLFVKHTSYMIILDKILNVSTWIYTCITVIVNRLQRVWSWTALRAPVYASDGLARNRNGRVWFPISYVRVSKEINTAGDVYLLWWPISTQLQQHIRNHSCNHTTGGFGYLNVYVNTSSETKYLPVY